MTDRRDDDSTDVVDYLNPQRTREPFDHAPNPAAARAEICAWIVIVCSVGFVVLPSSLNSAGVGGMVGTVVVYTLGLAVPIVSFLAVVFGIIGIQRTKTPGVGGQGRASFGLTFGILGLLLTLGVGGILYAFDQTYGPGGSVDRVKCRSNFNQLAAACADYAQQNGGALPNQLSDLATIDRTCLHCPSVDAAAGTPTKPSYVYLGTGLTTAGSPKTVILYELLTNHRKNGIHVLYLDGTVVWLEGLAARTFLSTIGRIAPTTRAKTD